MLVVGLNLGQKRLNDLRSKSQNVLGKKEKIVCAVNRKNRARVATELGSCQGAFTYDVRFLGRQVGQAPSDFSKQAYVVKYLIRVGRQVKNVQKHLTSYMNAPLFEHGLFLIFLVDIEN